MTVVEPDEISVLSTRGEHRPWADGNARLESQSMNLERIDRGRTLDPEEVSSRGDRDAVTRREMPVHGFQCNRLLIGQDAAKPYEVGFVAAIP